MEEYVKKEREFYRELFLEQIEQHNYKEVGNYLRRIRMLQKEQEEKGQQIQLKRKL